jgi:hypothetical protein
MKQASNTISNFCNSPDKSKGPPPAFQGASPENFNKCVSTINLFLSLTLRSKTAHLSQELYQKIIKISKLLGFGPDFYKKSISELNVFMRTKDFLVILRVRIHGLLNSVILDQFDQA